MLFYNNVTNGFYDSALNIKIPENSIEISREYFNELMDGCNDDKLTIGFDGQKPILITKELSEIDKKNKLILDAYNYLSSTDWIKNKYVDVVLIKKTMSDSEFKDKYSDELKKMDKAREIINT